MSMKHVRIRHMGTGMLLAVGPLGWVMTPFVGNFYIDRKYLKPTAFERITCLTFASLKEALYDVIDDRLRRRFGCKLAAQLVLGRHWRTARVARCSACLV